MNYLNKLEGYDHIACSIHLESDFFNVWDYLSAIGLSHIYNVKSVIWLPTNNQSHTWNYIYWWGWMIRPNFSKREVYKHFLSVEWKHSIIWVWINKDIKTLFEYTQEDYIALFSWINNAEYVSVRDYGTYDFIKENLYQWNMTRNIDINPCPSYSYLKSLYNWCNKKRYTCWIVPSFGHTKGYIPFVSNIKNMIVDFSNIFWEENILILCHDRHDLQISKEEFKNIDSILIKEFQDVIDYYPLCQYIVTVRAHGIIFASALWLKCSCVPLSDKLRTLYYYHYWSNEDQIDFNPIFHLNKLEYSNTPINI